MKILQIICAIIIIFSFSCKSAEDRTSSPAKEISEPPKNIEAKKQPEGLKNEPVKSKDENKDNPPEEKSPDIPEGAIDRDKLAQCYEEIYCAQKAGEMDKIVDIYKKYNFEKPEKFSRLWIKMAQDKDWMEKVIKEIPKKCPDSEEKQKETK
jgi:hypothetical protein